MKRQRAACWVQAAIEMCSVAGDVQRRWRYAGDIGNARLRACDLRRCAVRRDANRQCRSKAGDAERASVSDDAGVGAWREAGDRGDLVVLKNDKAAAAVAALSGCSATTTAAAAAKPCAGRIEQRISATHSALLV